jgi:hypothetical protein
MPPPPPAREPHRPQRDRWALAPGEGLKGENMEQSERQLGVVDLTSLVFPVVSVKPQSHELVLPVIYGTAFCIGPGIFLTAGHVARSAQGGGEPGLVVLGENEPVSVRRVLDCEVIDSHDVAVLTCKMPAIANLNWQAEPLRLLSDVGAFGFPYALSVEEEPPLWRLSMRAFKGYVVTRRRIWKLPSQPVGYAVSCPFPKGLSGAPLLRADPGIPDLVLVGMVIASGSVEINGEVTAFGEAVDILALQEVASRIIGGTLGDARRRQLASAGRYLPLD